MRMVPAPVFGWLCCFVACSYDAAPTGGPEVRSRPESLLANTHHEPPTAATKLPRSAGQAPLVLGSVPVASAGVASAPLPAAASGKGTSSLAPFPAAVSGRGPSLA